MNNHTLPPVVVVAFWAGIIVLCGYILNRVLAWYYRAQATKHLAQMKLEADREMERLRKEQRDRIEAAKGKWKALPKVPTASED